MGNEDGLALPRCQLIRSLSVAHCDFLLPREHATIWVDVNFAGVT